MKDIERGFSVFLNETIVSVDTTCINVVHFTTASGKRISVDAELSHYGISCPQVSTGYLDPNHKE